MLDLLLRNKYGKLMELIKGQCHCQNIRYQLTWPNHNKVIPARACGCSFCTKFNGCYTSHPDAKVDITIGDASQINRYRFGTRTADFYICKLCGIIPFVISEIDQQRYAVVNVNTFINFDHRRLQGNKSNFDAESEKERLLRRKQKWIADINFHQDQ